MPTTNKFEHVADPETRDALVSVMHPSKVLHALYVATHELIDDVAALNPEWPEGEVLGLAKRAQCLQRAKRSIQRGSVDDWRSARDALRSFWSV